MPYRNNKQNGFTFVEVVVALSVFALIMLITLMALASSTSIYSTTAAMGNTQERARAIVDKIANELKFCGPDECDGWNFPDQTEVKTISFSRPSGYDVGSSLKQWGAVITYSFQLDAGEVADGLDNDGDGLIDEAVLYRTENGTTVIEAKDLQYGNCSFYRVGHQIFIKCCTLKKDATRPDEPDRAYRRIYETSVSARN